MDRDEPPNSAVDRLIAQRLRALRKERGWSLDDLAKRSATSRATLSRLENAEVSGTASVLGRLCTAYGLTLSRLLGMIERDPVPVVTREEQPVWNDPEIGFRRRTVSPPNRILSGEVLECTLDPGTHVAYAAPPRPGLEHHLVLLEGRLTMMIEGRDHGLQPGDCLRYRLFGASAFSTPAETGARYFIFIV